MTEVAWAAIGLQAATLFGVLFWLGSRLDAIAARIDGLSARIDDMGTRIESRLDAHIERHAGRR